MDSTTVAIVLLFVFTIFSSFGGNQGYTPPAKNTIVKPPAARVALKSNLPRPAGSIDPTFKGGGGRLALSKIQNFILRFRQPAEATAISSAIIKHSQQYDVNPKLVTALMRRESGFNPRAISKSGAVGLGQLLPSTCKSTGVNNPYSIDENAKGTVRYVKYLLERFEKYSDQVSFALAGYLEGPNAVARKNGYTSKTAAYVNDIIGIYHKL